METGGPDGKSWVFYPQDLGAGGVRHAVFTWAAGSGNTPGQYLDHLERLASHGFVTISQASAASGTEQKAALDWILAENQRAGSPFYQKLDPQRVGVGGHSGGALATFQWASDPRLKLYVLACGGSGSGTSGAANIHAPTILLGGEGEGATMNFEGDYGAIKSPVAFVTRSNTDLIYCPRNNLAPWVAFMRWHFCGETNYRADFAAGGVYCQAPWTCKSKGL